MHISVIDWVYFYYAEQIAFETFHQNKKFARGYMAKYYIGDIVEEEREVCIYTNTYADLACSLLTLSNCNM